MSHVDGDQTDNSESNNSEYGDAPENVPNVNVMYRTTGQSALPVQTITVTAATGTPMK